MRLETITTANGLEGILGDENVPKPDGGEGCTNVLRNAEVYLHNGLSFSVCKITRQGRLVSPVTGHFLDTVFRVSQLSPIQINTDSKLRVNTSGRPRTLAAVPGSF